MSRKYHRDQLTFPLDREHYMLSGGYGGQEREVTMHYPCSEGANKSMFFPYGLKRFG